MIDKLDILNRDEFVLKVVEILDALIQSKKHCSFAIDGSWGIGKSFVIKMLNAKLKSKEVAVLNYNCWKDSYYDDPLLAIISSIFDEVCKNDYILKGVSDYNGAIKKLGIAVSDIIQHFTGVNIEKVVSKNGEDSFQTLSIKINKIKDIITEMARDKPIIIIVDEIDRCLPEYAIKVLERLYLIFNGLTNVYVVTVMDKNQLIHSVKQIFGEQIPIEDYLRKFISFTLPISKGDNEDTLFKKYGYYINKFEVYNEDTVEILDFLNGLTKNIDIRTQEIIFYRSNIIHDLIKTDCNSAALMCAEIFISTIYYVKGSYRDYYVNNLSMSNGTDNFAKVLLEPLNNQYPTYTNDRKRYNLNDSLYNRILVLCDNTDISNNDLGYSNHYIYGSFSKEIKPDIFAIKSFYKFLRYIK